jgi:hypothetical protein
MHYCLKVAELQNQILNNLPDAATARNLAITCHALSEPTLDILWRQWQHDLVPLLRILPLKANIHIVSKAISLNSNIYLSFHQILFREPTDLEWERFRVNAGRMTELSFNFEKPTEQGNASRCCRGIDEEAFASVNRYIGDSHTPLFPKLHTLTLGIINIFSRRQKNSQAARFCEYLSDAGQIKKIQVADVYLPNQTMISFANNNALDSFTFVCDWDGKFMSYALPFRGLKELILLVDHCEHVAPFLQACGPQVPLEIIKLSTSGASDYGDTIQGILEILESRCMNKTLVHFSFGLKCEYDSDYRILEDYDLTLTLDNVRPLRNFTSLAILQLSEAVYIEEEYQEDIGRFLAEAIPNLTTIGTKPPGFPSQAFDEDSGDDYLEENWSEGWLGIVATVERLLERKISIE